MTANLVPLSGLPDWVPSAVRIYLAHTEGGRSLRDIARCEGVHASTVLRQVRRFESRRDDPLIDCALGRLMVPAGPDPSPPSPPRMTPPLTPPTMPTVTEDTPMTMMIRDPDHTPEHAPERAPGHAAVLAAPPPDDRHLMDEARRLLPLLAQPEAMLVVAADMDRAILLREGPAGSERLAVLERAVAEAFALRDWIACRRAGRVAQYALAPEGRGLLRRLAAAGTRPVRAAAAAPPADEGEGRFRPPPESPVAVLARRRDRGGQPFLDARQVAAAERLREDFEIAQMEPRTTQDWQRALTGAAGRAGGGQIPGATPAAARTRVSAALQVLGPGLGDMALRCCCWQEGLEAAERQLGWSARSGKIVLRIALERLWRHYEAQGDAGKLIG